MGLIAIRGATTIDADTKDQIEYAALDLFFQILKRNKLSQKDIISIQISTTGDITEYYPATALRLNGCIAPLFSCLEPEIKNSLRLCIRFMVLARGDVPCHVYLRKAENLIAEK